MSVKIKEYQWDNPEFLSSFYRFCYRSRPLPFCEIHGPNLLTTKVNEYVDCLRDKNSLMGVFEGEELVGFVAYCRNNQELNMEFVFYCGNGRNGLEKIRLFLESIWLIMRATGFQKMRSTILREHRKKGFLKWISRYDPTCKISNNRVLWEYERVDFFLRSQRDNQKSVQSDL